MDLSDQTPETDISPAIPLEISAELAASVDAILEEFAEGAELETALVVEMSGALVSGISSEEMMVEIISALVAGASGAMSSLVRELGSSGNIESFHQSENRSVYLAEIIDRFILVGVSTVPVLVGIIREKARQVRPALIELLEEIEVEIPVPEPTPKPISLREMALAGAAEELPDIVPEPPVEEEANIFFEDEASTPEAAPIVEEAAPIEIEKPPLPEEPEVIEHPVAETVFEEVIEEPEPVAESEPAGVVEYIDDESPEVVIEDEAGMVVDSPFEAEEDIEAASVNEEEDNLPRDSIFELEEEEEPESIFEAVEEEEATAPEPLPEEAPPAERVFEVEDPDEDADDLASVFEMEDESEDDEKTSLFELELDDAEDDDEVMQLPEPQERRENLTQAPEVEVSAEVVEEDAEEEEAPASGPFYF